MARTGRLLRSPYQPYNAGRGVPLSALQGEVDATPQRPNMRQARERLMPNKARRQRVTATQLELAAKRPRWRMSGFEVRVSKAVNGRSDDVNESLSSSLYNNSPVRTAWSCPSTASVSQVACDQLLGQRCLSNHNHASFEEICKR